MSYLTARSVLLIRQAKLPSERAFSFLSDQATSLGAQFPFAPFDAGQAAAFLTVWQPDLLIYSGSCQQQSRALRAASVNSETVFVHVLPDFGTVDPFLLNSLSRAAFFRLPAYIHSAQTSNFLTDLIDKLLTQKTLKVRLPQSFYLIGEALLSQCLDKAIARLLVQADLCAAYDLAAATPAGAAEFVAFVTRELGQRLPGKKLARISLIEDKASCMPMDLLPYQYQFGRILPDWQDGVQETIVGYLARLRLL